MTEIYELTPEAYAAARPLFTGIPYDTAFMDAVFERRQPGRLFVDDPENPRGAILCRTYDYFLAGEATDALVQFLVDAPAEAEVFALLYGYVPTNDAWLAALRIADRLKLEEIPRRSFRLRAADAGVHATRQKDVPPHVTVVSIDVDLARRVDDELDEMIGLFWGGYGPFVAGGFGKVAVIDGRPVSVVFANVVSDREYNVSVGTARQHRREGLAKLVCRAMIADGAARGLDLTWDCDDANKASAALALSLGCVEEKPFTELGYLARRVPDLSRGLWSFWTTSPSVVTWTRSGAESPEP
jgi:RimJ/RimL family protein N-acetyltransferase